MLLLPLGFVVVVVVVLKSTCFAHVERERESVCGIVEEASERKSISLVKIDLY